jgi:hypothetical protein
MTARGVRRDTAGGPDPSAAWPQERCVRATHCPAWQVAEEGLAFPTGVVTNRVAAWLGAMDALRQALAA